MGIRNQTPPSYNRRPCQDVCRRFSPARGFRCRPRPAARPRPGPGTRCRLAGPLLGPNTPSIPNNTQRPLKPSPATAMSRCVGGTIPGLLFAPSPPNVGERPPVIFRLSPWRFSGCNEYIRGRQPSAVGAIWALSAAKKSAARGIIFLPRPAIYRNQR